MATKPEDFAAEVKDEYGGEEESTPAEKEGQHGLDLKRALELGDGKAIEECIRSIAGV